MLCSDLSMVATEPSASGRELLRKTISVNDPFRYGGLTMYQTDWALSAVQIRVVGNTDASTSSSSSTGSDIDTSSSSSGGGAGSGIGTLAGESITLPMASLEGKPGISGRLWGSYLPVAAPTPEELQQGRVPRGVSSK